jgi:hypothetical protein
MPFLLSLLSKIVYKLIKDLSINNAFNLLKSYYKNYYNSKYAFNKRYFRILLLLLEPISLIKARRFIEKK